MPRDGCCARCLCADGLVVPAGPSAWWNRAGRRGVVTGDHGAAKCWSVAAWSGWWRRSTGWPGWSSSGSSASSTSSPSSRRSASSPPSLASAGCSRAGRTCERPSATTRRRPHGGGDAGAQLAPGAKHGVPTPGHERQLQPLAHREHLRALRARAPTRSGRPTARTHAATVGRASAGRPEDLFSSPGPRQTGSMWCRSSPDTCRRRLPTSSRTLRAEGRPSIPSLKAAASSRRSQNRSHAARRCGRRKLDR